MGWWRASSEDAENWYGPEATKEDAIAAGRSDEFDSGEPFVVMEAERQPWRFSCFDGLADLFDDANEELGDGDGDPPSVDAGIATPGGVKPELEKHLEAALEAWVTEHGKPTAGALAFTGPLYSVPATAEWHAQFQRGEVD